MTIRRWGQSASAKPATVSQIQAAVEQAERMTRAINSTTTSGTMATQDPASVAIIGGSIEGVSMDLASGQAYRINGTQVVGARQSAIANASGGATIDTEARTALNAVLAALRAHGLIAT